MSKHEHVWEALDYMGNFEAQCIAADCPGDEIGDGLRSEPATLNLQDINRRLNATQMLSAKRAKNIGRKGPRGELEIPLLMAYAATLESDDSSD